ncbi:hypothetical protein YC2023_082464 [Brassica napus]
MESTGKSPVSSDRKPKRKILSSSAISKTPTGKSVAASEIAIKPNGKTAVSSAIPRSQSSSAHGDDVMFFRDVTSRGVTVSSDTFLGGSKPKHEDTHWRGDAPH